MRALLPAMLLLAACASQGGSSAAKPDQGFCGDTSAEKCQELLDQRKVTNSQQIDALMAAGAANFLNDKFPVAVSFYDAVVERDEENVDAYLMRANANVKLGLQLQKDSNATNQVLAQTYYGVASTDYIRVIALDPNNQAAYVGAVATTAQSGGCGLAKSIREMHEKRFGQTAVQQELVAVIGKKCD